MFEISKDVEFKLQKKYPQVNIRNVITDLFTIILEKTLTSGVFKIRNLGRFVAYVAYSSYWKREVCRFKFIPYRTLIDKILHDDYLIRTLTAFKPRKTRTISPETFAIASRTVRNNNKCAFELVRSRGDVFTDKEYVEDFIRNLTNPVREKKEDQ